MGRLGNRGVRQITQWHPSIEANRCIYLLYEKLYDLQVFMLFVEPQFQFHNL